MSNARALELVSLLVDDWINQCQRQLEAGQELQEALARLRDDELEGYVSARDAAQVFGVSEKTIRRMAQDGQLATRQARGRLVIARESLKPLT